MAALQLNMVLSPHTIKVMETLEGCSIEEIGRKIVSAFKSTATEEITDSIARNTAWLDNYPPMLQACHVQEILGICEATAYQVMHQKGCPTLYLGKRMVVPREDFWQFILANRGKQIW